MSTRPGLRVGVLGCGPIAQFAHFDAARKARNLELHALCDVAPDLLARAAAIHQPAATYGDYEHMLADPRVDAVIVATADAFHVPAARAALAAGKHVFVEKPLGTSVEECDDLVKAVEASGLVLQVGNNRRFDPGVSFARDFIGAEVGELVGLKAWYRDSTSRYAMTDNLQPIPLRSASARRPAGDPKSDRARYFMLTHGSHLVDTARYLGGEISSVRARHSARFDSHCWFVDTEFTSGCLGHLELTIPIAGDMEEGFTAWGEGGSVKARVPLTWYHKAAEVECFSVRDGVFRRPLGADAYSFRIQLEAFADAILDGAPMRGADVHDGIAAMRAMVAISQSVRTGEAVALAAVRGGV